MLKEEISANLLMNLIYGICRGCLYRGTRTEESTQDNFNSSWDEASCSYVKGDEVSMMSCLRLEYLSFMELFDCIMLRKLIQTDGMYCGG